ncbi:hypothetical protein FA13DRAFT_567849 [Coprinellus micaceus]|uniref:Uncharacterized protein n=1 Tax=Coprinellus micaceus TaxID=71717 RepID=A0A4Y7T918_COPMI|nr:hypothetical protein FA13DRAFT_567849 [Coprinellus micaceus]
MPSTSQATPTMTNSESQQRGRNASPKRLVSSAQNSRANSIVPIPKPTPVVEASTSSDPPVEEKEDEQPTSDANANTEERPKVTLVERVTTEWTRPAATRPQERPSQLAHPTQTVNDPTASESLAIAAAEYPWLYMSSTLDACFQNDAPQPPNQPSTRDESGSGGDEAGPSTSQALPTEKLKFVDEESDKFAKTAPAVMQAFHAHGEAYSRIEAGALKLALHGPESKNPTGEDVEGSDDGYDDGEAKMQVYRDMLDELEKLHTQALALESSLVELTESFSESKPTSVPGDEEEADAGEPSKQPEEPSAKSQILSLIAASLPVLRARIMNISMAQELVDSALENVSIGLRMESLGIE